VPFRIIREAIKGEEKSEVDRERERERENQKKRKREEEKQPEKESTGTERERSSRVLLRPPLRLLFIVS